MAIVTGSLWLLTLARKLISKRVYGFSRSIRYCVRNERRTSSMYVLMNGSSKIVDLLSAQRMLASVDITLWRHILRMIFSASKMSLC